jgi:hypothetical protein
MLEEFTDFDLIARWKRALDSRDLGAGGRVKCDLI